MVQKQQPTTDPLGYRDKPALPVQAGEEVCIETPLGRLLVKVNEKPGGHVHVEIAWSRDMRSKVYYPFSGVVLEATPTLTGPARRPEEL